MVAPGLGRAALGLGDRAPVLGDGVASGARSGGRRRGEGRASGTAAPGTGVRDAGDWGLGARRRI